MPSEKSGVISMLSVADLIERLISRRLSHHTEDVENGTKIAREKLGREVDKLLAKVIRDGDEDGHGHLG